jgi:hypothetical protein
MRYQHNSLNQDTLYVPVKRKTSVMEAFAGYGNYWFDIDLNEELKYPHTVKLLFMLYFGMSYYYDFVVVLMLLIIRFPFSKEIKQFCYLFTLR